MAKPRMMFYEDGRHAHIYNYEPPMQKEEYEAAVDNLLGTPIEAIMFGLSEGRTMLHDTKVGELWGHNVDKWPHLIWRRTHQNAKALIEAGNDPLRVICDHARVNDLLIYPSLILQVGSDERGSGLATWVRCSDFRFDNKHLEIRAGGDLDLSIEGIDGLDFKHQEVQDERFAIIDEVLTNYQVDGFELQMEGLLFHPDELDEGRKTMTEWMKRVRQAVKRSGEHRELAVRVPADLELCLSYGMDLRDWIAQGIVDVITADAGFGDAVNPMADFRPFVDAAKGSGCRIHAAVQDAVNSDRLSDAPVEMMRAMVSNYWAQGVDGLYLARGWFYDWPFDGRFYEKVRELPYPRLMEARDKLYHIATVPGPQAPERQTDRPLPAYLEVNEPARLDFTITDDLPRWDAVHRVHEVLLRVRIMQSTELDRFSFKLNGQELPTASLRMINELLGKLKAPRYIVYGYWYVFTLDRDHWPRQGANTLEVTLLERDPDVTPQVLVRDVELEIKYLMGKNFRRDFSDPALGPWQGVNSGSW